MTEEAARYPSKRARDIIIESDGDTSDMQAPPAGPAAAKIREIKDVRDRFDMESRQVGLRDSTWLLVSALCLLLIAVSWSHPTGLDLFARLLVIGGGVTIAATIACRNFLSAT